MKKIFILLFLLSILMPFLVIIIGNGKLTDFEFYSIKTNYSFVEDDNRKMNFYVYSKINNPLISYPNKNSYQIKLDNQSFFLDNVHCKEHTYKNNSLIIIEADIPNITDTEYISETCELVIINSSYKVSLDLGSFSIIDSKYFNLLSLSALSATYSYIDDSKYLTGINLELSGNYNFIESFRIGGFNYGTLSRSKFSLELDNEEDIRDYIINYNKDRVEKEYLLQIQNNKIFIPISYILDYFIKEGYIVIKIDNVNYYFDTFPFMVTYPDYNSFFNKLEKGEFINV